MSFHQDVPEPDDPLEDDDLADELEEPVDPLLADPPTSHGTQAPRINPQMDEEDNRELPPEEADEEIANDETLEEEDTL